MKHTFFKYLYIILSELCESMEQGKRIDVDMIRPQRFQISESYWLDIIQYAMEKGLIDGVRVKQSKTGRVVLGVEDMRITGDGVLCLEENATMRKVYNALKDLRDWTRIGV